MILDYCFEVEQIEENELGRGTFGIVYKGWKINTQEEVAVKKVKISGQTRTYIKRELTFLKKCEHSNIVKLFWSGKDEHYAYFVMEYCPFGNLNYFMKNREISCELCLSFMLNISEALLYIHERNISHRDIKPLNVLVKEGGSGGFYLILADFGLARFFPTSSTGMNATHGIGIS